MQEVAASKQVPKFGSVVEISKPDWEQEVTRAPAESPVVIHLYQEHVVECKILNELLAQLAIKHPETKFIKSVATKSVENFQDRDCPALIFYKGGSVTGQIIPAGPVLGGSRMNIKTVEYLLFINHQVKAEFPEGDPRDKLKLINTIIKRGKDAGRHHEDDVDSEGEDDREYVSNQFTRYK